jgi:hypothetical protein
MIKTYFHWKSISLQFYIKQGVIGILKLNKNTQGKSLIAFYTLRKFYKVIFKFAEMIS